MTISSRAVVVSLFSVSRSDMGWRLPFVQSLVVACGVNVVMADYRGYGMSTGAPDEEVSTRGTAQMLCQNPFTENQVSRVVVSVLCTRCACSAGLCAGTA